MNNSYFVLLIENRTACSKNVMLLHFNATTLKNVKTGKYRLLFNDDEGKWNTIEVKMGDTLK
jgi:hypothetical protein